MTDESYNVPGSTRDDQGGSNFYTFSTGQNRDSLFERFGGVKMCSQSQDPNEYRYDSEFYLSNYYDYKQGSAEPIVKGRMKTNIASWKQIGAPEYIVQVIEHGYKIRLVHTPPPARFNNNKSALNNADFLTEAINELVAKNLVIECSCTPDIVNPLTVSVQTSGKKRLILDLRYVNQYVWKQKIHFDDYKVAKQFFSLDYFMFSFDLKSGYHHIEIFQEHCQFLSFSWEFNGVTKYFSFQVLPFGLTLSSFYIYKMHKTIG